MTSRYKPILVLSKYSSGEILRVLPQDQFIVRDFSRNNFELSILMRSALRRLPNWIGYAVTLIQQNRARVVITGLDTNPYFYFLKHFLPEVQFISIQNGIRGSVANPGALDFWSQLSMISELTNKNPIVDYLLTFGDAHSDLYDQYITGAKIPIGSIGNNNFVFDEVRHLGVRAEGLSLISIFDGKPYSELFEDGYLTSSKQLGKSQVSARDYYRDHMKLARVLAMYCREQSIDFYILGKREEDFKWEQEFFRRACQGLPYKLLHRPMNESSISSALRANLTISHGSTLGYELFSRGHNVGFVNRSVDLDDPLFGHQFFYGYPDKYSNEGDFWTSDNSLQGIAKLVMRVVNGVRSSSPFAELHNQRLMRFDPRNVGFTSLLSSLLSSVLS